MQLPRIDWSEAVSEALKWADERAWPLGAGGILLATMYLYQYIALEHIPLSITSTSVLTAFPALLGLIVFIILITAAFFLMPLLALFTPAANEGKSFAVLIYELPNRRETNWRKFVLSRWILTTTLAAIAMFLVLFSLIAGTATSEWQGPIMVAAALIVSIAWSIAWSRYGRRSAQPAHGSTSWDFKFLTFASGLIQVLVLTQCLHLAIQWVRPFLAATSTIHLQGLIIFFCFIALTTAATLLQIAGVIFAVEAIRHRQPLARVMQAIVFLLVILAIVPGTGAKIAAYAFQFSASGARDCVVFQWTPDPPASIDSLRECESCDRSIPLRVLADADGYYMTRNVEAKDSQAIELVPRTTVRAVDNCAKPKASTQDRPQGIRT